MTAVMGINKLSILKTMHSYMLSVTLSNVVLFDDSNRFSNVTDTKELPTVETYKCVPFLA